MTTLRMFNVYLNTPTDLPSFYTPIRARAEEWALGCESENFMLKTGCG